MLTSLLFGLSVCIRIVCSGPALAAFPIAGLAASAYAGEPKKDDNRKGAGEQEVPVCGDFNDERDLGQLKIVTSKRHLKFDPKDVVPEAILQLCKEDIKRATPPYPSIDVGKLEVYEIWARGGNGEMQVCYIIFGQPVGARKAGGVVYVYDITKKALTRKFWRVPQPEN